MKRLDGRCWRGWLIQLVEDYDLRIEIRQGDITDQPDIAAIVNAANTELWLGSGVAGAILRKGGATIDEEARRQGPVRLGDAVVTTAGKLPNRYVIHAAAMGYRDEDLAVPKKPGTESSAEIIRNATLNSLKHADHLHLDSIAFPALATGVAAFPVDECAQVMIDAVRDFAAEHPESAVKRAIFVLFTLDDYRIFNEYAKKQGSGVDPQ